MTRRHYERIAAILNNNLDGDMQYIVEDLCEFFKEDNPRFDKKKFEDRVFAH